MWLSWTCLWRVVVDSHEWPNSSWIALRSRPRAYSDEAQKCRSPCGVNCPSHAGSHRPDRRRPGRCVARRRRRGASGQCGDRVARWAAAERRDQTSHRRTGGARRSTTTPSSHRLRRSLGSVWSSGPRPMTALAEAHMQLAVLAQVRAPVADIQHHRLADPQPRTTPQRRGQVIPRCGQELPRLGQGLTPATRNNCPISSSAGGTRMTW